MDWFKMSARIYTDPDVLALSPPAFKTWVLALAWVADYEADGIYRMVGKESKAVTELVAAGRFVPQGEGRYEVVGWGKWQKSKEDLDKVREERKKAGKAGANAKQVAKQTVSKSPADLEVEVEEPTSKAQPKAENGNPFQPTHDQIYLGAKVDLGTAAICKLNKRYGRSAVSEGLRRLCTGDIAAIEKPYAYLRTLLELPSIEAIA